MLSHEVSSSLKVAPDLIKAPFAYAQVTLNKRDYIEPKAQSKQWRTQWQHTRKREQESLDQIARIKVERSREIAVFQTQVETLKNQLAEMHHLVFARSTG